MSTHITAPDNARGALMICDYDTGSATGCMPACSAPATHVVSWDVPCYGTFTATVCARHVRPTKGRALPSDGTVSAL